MTSYLVVGASRGIGLAFVKQLSANPQNKVFAGVRNVESSIHLQPLLSRPNVHAIKLDMTDVISLKAAAEEVARINHGKLDILIINAGLTGSGKPFKDCTYEEIIEEHSMFTNNVLGPVLTIKAFLPLVSQGAQKKIIAISSANADSEFILTVGFDKGATYTATKAALNAYITKLSLQYRQEGIVFRSICPGLVDTGATRDPPILDQSRYEPRLKQIKPLFPDFKGPLTPEQSVDAVLEVIDKTTMADSGTFVSHKGNKDWL
ncbi:hypothetical protein M408DRAFT_20932 [Serendipita vermifera MAFF 305830]|uniref:NAD(P)-binding protein n=1 Tax=Serendipita vermifera MAFF 305830 TaxID=933852 RepID=A0A0C3BJQ9_SERVB|nr:hypothetical protein M408DRAFT_20932 [Serendipita vermifera MAFF 305830]